MIAGTCGKVEKSSSSKKCICPTSPNTTTSATVAADPTKKGDARKCPWNRKADTNIIAKGIIVIADYRSVTKAYRYSRKTKDEVRPLIV